MNPVDGFFRPRDPFSGWYWGGTAGDFAAMSDDEKRKTEELSISVGNKPPLSMTRVALAVGALAAAWYVLR